jgi:N-carbamoylputrescine amidase
LIGQLLSQQIDPTIGEIMSTDNTIRQVYVAAVQAKARLGFIPENLGHFTPLVEQAARQGAQLVILPELAASGYSMAKLIWDSGETRNGPTLHWLCDISKRLGTYVGIGFLETDGADFYNAYAIGAPDGHLAGIIRKTMAETAVFKSAQGTHTIDTEIGRLGVGICADNHFVTLVRQMQAQSVDIMLMPHAVPTPFKVGGLVSEEDIPRNNLKLRATAPLYSQLLGVPAMFVNSVGPLGGEKWPGLFGRIYKPDQFRLGGLSVIVDSDGTIKGEADGSSECVVMAQITLDPSRKINIVPTAYGRYGGGWIDPGISSNMARDAICSIDSIFGRVSYTLSRLRGRKAQAILSDSTASCVD